MNASLSKKRKKQLNELRADAELLLQRQQEVLSHAGAVALEASRQAGHFTREEVAPRLRDGYEDYVVPGARKIASQTSDVIHKGVIPAVGTVLGTALSVVDVAQDARVQAAVKRLSNVAGVPKAAGKAAGKAAAKASKKKSGVGTTVVLLLGIGALAGVAYAVWQTFRADDELWVADDEQ